jgi:hypothetical protein
VCFLLTKTYMDVGNWEVRFRSARSRSVVQSGLMSEIVTRPVRPLPPSS